MEKHVLFQWGVLSSTLGENDGVQTQQRWYVSRFKWKKWVVCTLEEAWPKYHMQERKGRIQQRNKRSGNSKQSWQDPRQEATAETKLLPLLLNWMWKEWEKKGLKARKQHWFSWRIKNYFSWWILGRLHWGSWVPGNAQKRRLK